MDTKPMKSVVKTLIAVEHWLLYNHMVADVFVEDFLSQFSSHADMIKLFDEYTQQANDLLDEQQPKQPKQQLPAKKADNRKKKMRR
jgi:hypothetical protein